VRNHHVVTGSATWSIDLPVSRPEVVLPAPVAISTRLRSKRCSASDRSMPAIAVI